MTSTGPTLKASGLCGRSWPLQTEAFWPQLPRTTNPTERQNQQDASKSRWRTKSLPRATWLRSLRGGAPAPSTWRYQTLTIRVVTFWASNATDRLITAPVPPATVTACATRCWKDSVGDCIERGVRSGPATHSESWNASWRRSPPTKRQSHLPFRNPNRLSRPQ